MIELAHTQNIINIAAMKRIILLLVAAVVLPGWTVTNEHGQVWASARDGDATLLVGCLNGQVLPRLVWPQRIGFGTLGMTYRVDNGPTVPRMAMLSQDGRTLYAWPLSEGGVLRARRVQVTISGDVYDFDVTKGAGLPKWNGC